MRLEQAASVLTARLFTGAFRFRAAMLDAIPGGALLLLAPCGSLADRPQIDDIAHVRTRRHRIQIKGGFLAEPRSSFAPIRPYRGSASRGCPACNAHAVHLELATIECSENCLERKTPLVEG